MPEIDVTMGFVDELRWRGMLQDIMPGTEELLGKGMVSGYIGFDPTADSLHVGSLAQIMTLLHFQRSGHRPIALVGGATGMIGDPSGKKEERKLLTTDELKYNEEGIKKQLERFLDFKAKTNPAIIVNNSDWFGQIYMIAFLRDIGKYLTVNYLLGKGFIKDRMDQDLSFTEFNYILMQAYDFLWLYENMNCKLQMGGSDQWGNITAGTELIRKKIRGQAFGLTCKLITKADGSKFGKTESGNIWLDPKKTSPYAFYQFWLNASDEDIKSYIRIFSLKGKEEIEQLEAEHASAPHTRVLQKALAEEITIRVHSPEDYKKSANISEILFNGSAGELKKIPPEDFLSVYESLGKNAFHVSRNEVEKGINILDLLAVRSAIFTSKGEARKMLQGGGVLLNKEKISDFNLVVTSSHLINNKFLLVQKGKKNYYLLKAE